MTKTCVFFCGNPQLQLRNSREFEMVRIEDDINSSREWFTQRYETLKSSCLNLTVNEGLRSLQNAAVLTGSFYLSMNAFQRIAGRLNIHSGRPFPVASLFGCVSIAVSSALSFEANESLPYIVPKPQSQNFADFLVPQHRRLDQKILIDERIQASIFAYFLLESKYLLTSVPSSIISTGVHANDRVFPSMPRMFRGSVRSTDATATEKQRVKIQQLGKR